MATHTSPTQYARVVLSDCEESLLELLNSKQETLRRRWVATLALLRAVGNVLGNVDVESSDVAKAQIEAEWAATNRSYPEPKIFWKFIWDERNTVLKQYRFAVRGNVTIAMPGTTANAGDTMPPGSVGTVTDPGGNRAMTSRFNLVPLIDGSYAGHDPITVVREANRFLACLSQPHRPRCRDSAW
jgi:hypothetical protein